MAKVSPLFDGNREDSFLKLLTPLTLLVGRLMQVGISVASVKALTYFLPPAEVGRVYLLLALAGFVNLSLLAGPTHYLQRHFLEYQRMGAGRETLYTACLVFVAVAFAGCFAAWLAMRLGLIGSERPITTSMAIGVFIVGGVAAQCAAMLNLLDCQIESVMVSTLSALSAFTAALALSISSSASAERWVWGQALGFSASATIAVVLVLRRMNVHDSFAWPQLRRVREIRSVQIREALTFTWPLAVIVGLYWFFSQGYRFPLERRLGAETVGFFGIAYAVGAMIVSSAEAVMNQWVTPIFYRRIVGGTQNATTLLWRQFVARMIGLYIPITAFAIGAAPLLMQFVTSSSFHGAAKLAFWGGLVESIRVVAGLIYQGGIAQKETKKMIMPHVFGAATAMLGVYFLPGLLGLPGVGVGLVAAYIVLVVGLWWTVDRGIFSELNINRCLLPCSGAALIGVIFSWGAQHGAVSNSFLAVLVCAGGALTLGGVLAIQGWQFGWSLEPEGIS